MNEMNGFNNHGRASPHRLGDRLQVQGDFFIYLKIRSDGRVPGVVYGDSINGGPAPGSLSSLEVSVITVCLKSTTSLVVYRTSIVVSCHRPQYSPGVWEPTLAPEQHVRCTYRSSPPLCPHPHSAGSSFSRHWAPAALACSCSKSPVEGRLAAARVHLCVMRIGLHPARSS